MRTTGNQRRYEQSTLRRVAFIRTAQRVGLSLDEIGEALATLPDGRAPTKSDWHRLSKAWRPRLDEQIERIERLRDRLDGCIGCGCLSLKTCALSNPDDEAASGDRARSSSSRDAAPASARSSRRHAPRPDSRHGAAHRREPTGPGAAGAAVVDPAGGVDTSTSCRSPAACRGTSCGSSGSAATLRRQGDPSSRVAFREYRLLRDLQRLGLPAVVPRRAWSPAASTTDGEELPAALLTQHLQFSLPYRSLFSHGLTADNLPSLVDAMVVLLVRLHLAGLLLGRRVAVQRAVPAQRRRVRGVPRRRRDRRAQVELSDRLREYDLTVATENVFAELLDLQASDSLDDEVAGARHRRDARRRGTTRCGPS